MTAFEKFKTRQRNKLIQNWPGSLPPDLRSLKRDQFMEALRMSDWAEKIPDAELTPEIVALGQMHKEATRKSYEAFVRMGQILLELKRRFPVEAEFWEHVAKIVKAPRAEAMLAMEAAEEEN